MKLEIDIKLRAAVRYDEEAAIWVSWCPALDVYSQGTSRQLAQEALEEALFMYVRYCFQKQILGKVLTSRGFEAGAKEEPSSSSNDNVFDEFIQIRPVQDARRHTPSIFDVVVPLPLVAGAMDPLVSGPRIAAA